MSIEPKRYYIFGEFDGAHFNGEYTAQEVVDRINADSNSFKAELAGDVVRVIPQENNYKSVVTIGNAP